MSICMRVPEIMECKPGQLSSDILAWFPMAHSVSAEKPNRVNYLPVANIQHKPCCQPHTHTVLAQRYHTTHKQKECTANQNHSMPNEMHACCLIVLYFLLVVIWLAKAFRLKYLRFVWLYKSFHFKASVVKDCNSSIPTVMYWLTWFVIAVWEWLTLIIVYLWTFQMNFFQMNISSFFSFFK